MRPSDELKTKAIGIRCAGCGAALEVGKSVDIVTCLYCGVSQEVVRSESSIGLRIIEGVARIQEGTDRTADELAIRRMKDEYEELLEKRTKIEARLASVRGSNSMLFAWALGGVFVGILLVIGVNIWVGLVVVALAGYLFREWNSRENETNTMEKGFRKQLDHEQTVLLKRIEARRKRLEAK